MIDIYPSRHFARGEDRNRPARHRHFSWRLLRLKASSGSFGIVFLHLQESCCATRQRPALFLSSPLLLITTIFFWFSFSQMRALCSVSSSSCGLLTFPPFNLNLKGSQRETRRHPHFSSTWSRSSGTRSFTLLQPCDRRPRCSGRLHASYSLKVLFPPDSDLVYSSLYVCMYAWSLFFLNMILFSHFGLVTCLLDRIIFMFLNMHF